MFKKKSKVKLSNYDGYTNYKHNNSYKPHIFAIILLIPFVLFLSYLSKEKQDKTINKKEQIVSQTFNIEETKKENINKNIIQIEKIIFNNELKKYNTKRIEIIKPKKEEKISKMEGRYHFTDKVVNREPNKFLYEVPKEQLSVFFYSSILNQKGKTLTHNWYINGEKKYSKSFDIKSNRWRVWTSKKIWDKESKVYTEITDEEGKVLGRFFLQK